MPRFQNKIINKKEKIEDIPLNINDLYKWVIIVVLVFGFAFLIVSLIKGEINFNLFEKKLEEQIPEATIDYSKILAGETFNKNHNEYYVVFYDFSSSDSGNYEAYIIDKKTPVYKVDTNDKMNSQYITDSNPNKNPVNITDLKVKEPTLIKITNKTISDYIESKDLIIAELEKLN